jgi:hypothetical protein
MVLTFRPLPLKHIYASLSLQLVGQNSRLFTSSLRSLVRESLTTSDRAI